MCVWFEKRIYLGRMESGNIKWIYPLDSFLVFIIFIISIISIFFQLEK